MSTVTTVERLTGRDLSKGRPGGLEGGQREKQCCVPRLSALVFNDLPSALLSIVSGQEFDPDRDETG